MTQGPADFGSDPWDEFLARYFGRGEGRRPGQRVDITRLMTADARELLAEAARRAAQKRSADLDTDHLLWAALQREPLRDLVSRAGADPYALVNALGGRGNGVPKGQVPPHLSLTPAAKRALLDMYCEVADLDEGTTDVWAFSGAHGQASGLGEAVRTLAQAYRAWPGWQEQWVHHPGQGDTTVS